MVYLKLFWSFFQIGLFSIGGGYAAMPLLQNQVVDLNNWLTMAEFTDIITISQMTPGPIAINAATFVGIKIAGIKGAILCTIGCITPSCIITLILAKLYYKYRKLTIMQGILNGLRPAVVALIASAGLSIFSLTIFDTNQIPFNMSHVDFIALGIFLVCFIILQKLKLNPIYVMLIAGTMRLCANWFI
ncbi:MAG: chromate transporter [Clostridia bacterium]|jgi:chromate transporter|nr:chromate transporter [Clostridia bacterium]